MNTIRLIEFEEGWRSKPYLCSEGYPTVGFGFKIGPKGVSLKQYQFSLPRKAGEIWLAELLLELDCKMEQYDSIRSALERCNGARQAVLASMAYQMGVSGLAEFRKALAAIDIEDWYEARNQLLDSRWARQTPRRAKRHAEQLLSGEWCKEY